MIVTDMLLDGLGGCRVSLAPALMSSPAAESHIVDVVFHYCTRFTLASSGTGCCIQLPTNCLTCIPLFDVPLLTQHIDDSERAAA